MTRIGILTGLTAEARLLHYVVPGDGIAPVIARTAADSARATREAEQLVGLGAVALVSFGLAGGLAPDVQAGDLIFADRVILPDGRSIATDSAWLEAALKCTGIRGRSPRIGPIAGTETLLATTADKQRLASASGALAGDMESAAAALVAEREGMPFIVVRAVSDALENSLPTVARVPLRPCGSLRFDAVAGALCRHPSEWPAVARLARDTRAALMSLRTAVQAGALVPPALAGLPRSAPTQPAPRLAWEALAA